MPFGGNAKVREIFLTGASSHTKEAVFQKDSRTFYSLQVMMVPYWTTENQPFNQLNADIERPYDGNALIAGRILGNQRAKIAWGLPTP